MCRNVLEGTSMADDPPTIDSVARSVLEKVAPRQISFLDSTASEIFAGGATSRRAMLAALGDGRTGRPTGFGAESMGLVVGFLLSVLNGVACEILTDQVTERSGALVRRWRARRERRALASRPAPRGLDTKLPPLGAVQAAQVGQRVLGLAREAGIPEEQAHRISTLIAAELTTA
ncbi:hypothetical protein [Sphaerisporangium rhizosphaerae]|uniref:Uncharacterized protein n=1 Tax=Sphaerisporangium rhizosphaerae TaxID=2269375 RepID=A0ABW2P9J5_9ACTN